MSSQSIYSISNEWSQIEENINNINKMQKELNDKIEGDGSSSMFVHESMSKDSKDSKDSKEYKDLDTSGKKIGRFTVTTDLSDTSDDLYNPNDPYPSNDPYHSNDPYNLNCQDGHDNPDDLLESREYGYMSGDDDSTDTINVETDMSKLLVNTQSSLNTFNTDEQRERSRRNRRMARFNSRNISNLDSVRGLQEYSRHTQFQTQLQSRLQSPKELYESAVQKVGERINQYIMNPKDVLDLTGIRNLGRLPDAIKDFSSIKTLKIINCDIYDLSNIPCNLESLIIRNNNLKELNDKDLPKTLVHIDATKNQINDINLQNSNVQNLIVSHNSLSGKLFFPEIMDSLDVNNSEIKDSELFTNLCLNQLNISSTKITDINGLPDSIKILKMNRLEIKVIIKLPPELGELYAQNSSIEHIAIDEFPQSLKVIDLYNNKLTIIPKLPSIVSSVDLMSNQLINIPNFPDKILKEFDIRHNPVIDNNEEGVAQMSIDLKTTNPGATIMFGTIDEINDDKNTDAYSSNALKDFFEPHISDPDIPDGLNYTNTVNTTTINTTNTINDQSNRAISTNPNSRYYSSELDNFYKFINKPNSNQNSDKDKQNMINNMFPKSGGSNNETKDNSDQNGVTINTTTLQNIQMRSNLFSRNSGNTVNASITNNYSSNYSSIQNITTNPRNNISLVKNMTDDGHRCNKKYHIYHKSIYTVN